MKNIRLLLLFFAVSLLTVQIHAQKKSTNPINKIVKKKSLKKFTGNEVLQGEVKPSTHQQAYEEFLASGAEAVSPETWIGFTSYDLQTNAAVKHRIHGFGDDNLVAAWTCHPETSDPATTFPNRGTCVNTLENGSWGAFPVARIEENTRTGWSNIMVTSTGRRVVVNHASPGSYVVVFTQDDPNGPWTEFPLPTSTGVEMLWPTATVSGNTIHVIAITRPLTNGVIYENLDGAVLYYRSLDGGDTWDIQDFIVPGTDSMSYIGHDVDSYNIAAKGDDVAFAIFDSWGDVITCYSNSNGDVGSWTTRKPFDFPLFKYVADTGYTIDDIGGIDPNAPNDLAIETNDGTGGLDIDNDGIVHLTFGRMYVMDDDVTDGTTSFFPGTNGLFYWNSAMPDDGATYIDAVFDAIDVDGDGEIGAGEDFPSYGGGLTSMADLIVNNDGVVVISYAQHMENYLRESTATAPSQNYRHVHIVASTDDGATWQPAYDVTNPDVLFFPALITQTEAVYPSIYNNGTDRVHLLYQMDEEPGVFLNEADDGITSNTIAHWSFELNDVWESISVEEVVDPNALRFKVVPNPATDQVQISYQLDEAARTKIQVTDMMGRKVMEVAEKLVSTGKQTTDLDIANLTAGIYLVSIRTNNQLATQKLLVH